MAETPKKEETSLVRGLIALNEGVKISVGSFLATPWYLADLINMGTKAAFDKKIYNGPSGSEVKARILETGDSVENSYRRAVGAQQLEKFEARTTAEEVLHKAGELGGDTAIALATMGAGSLSKAKAGVEIAEATAKKSSAKVAQVRIEPTLDAATAGQTAKAAAPAAETVVKKTSTRAADDAVAAASARLEAAQKAGAAERTGQTAGQTASKTTGEAAETATSGAEKAGARAADAAIDGVKIAAEAGSKLSRREALRTLNADKSLADKLDILNRGQRSGLFERALIHARRNGLKEGDNLAVQRLSGIPDSLKARVQEISDLQIKGSFTAKTTDAIKATLLDIPNHPFRSTWDLFATQWRIPFALPGIIKGHKTAAVGAVLAGSALHGATDGASTKLAGQTIGTVIDGYAAVDKSLAGLSLVAGKKILDTVSMDGAEKTAILAGETATDVAKQTPGFLFGLGAYMAGTTPEEISGDPVRFSNEHPVLSFLLPGPVKNLLTGAKLADRARQPQTEDNITSVLAGTSGNSSGQPRPSVREHAASVAAATGHKAGEVAVHARDKAGAVVDEVEEKAAKVLEGIDIGTIMSDPKAAWSKLKLAGKADPKLAKLIEIGEKYPGMQMGVLAGIGLGAVFGEGGAKGRLASALRTALVLGFIFDMIAPLFGKKSAIMSMVHSAANGESPAPAPVVTSPAKVIAAAPPTATVALKPENDVLAQPGITADVSARDGFISAKTAQTPQQIAVAPAVNKTKLNGNFFDQSTAAPKPDDLPPAPVAQVSQNKKAANFPELVLVSNG